MFAAFGGSMAQAQAVDTAAVDTAAVGAAPDSALLTPAAISRGRKIFHGRGTCHACHGNKLKGGPIAPRLTGPKWRHIDGSFASIVSRIEHGAPGTVMPASPGGITRQQILEVASYIYAVSRGQADP